MKKQLLKRLFAFIVMMLSIYFLNAQCPGNKVQLYKSTRGGGCISKCVPQNQVQKYMSQGWGPFCTSSYPFKSNSKVPGAISSVTLIDEIQLTKKRKVIDSKK